MSLGSAFQSPESKRAHVRGLFATLLMLPLDYFTGAFTHDSFLAQAVCACFAVAAWWALLTFAWVEGRNAQAAVIFNGRARWHGALILAKWCTL